MKTIELPHVPNIIFSQKYYRRYKEDFINTNKYKTNPKKYDLRIKEANFFFGSNGSLLTYMKRKNAIDKSDVKEGEMREKGMSEKDIIGYMKDRNGSTGLFDIEGSIDDDKAKQLNEFLANIPNMGWSCVMSFLPEYSNENVSNPYQAQKLLSVMVPEQLKVQGLDPKDYYWFAAYHTNTDHKHIHYVIVPKDGSTLPKAFIDKDIVTLMPKLVEKYFPLKENHFPLDRDYFMEEYTKDFEELSPRLINAFNDIIIKKKQYRRLNKEERQIVNSVAWNVLKRHLIMNKRTHKTKKVSKTGFPGVYKTTGANTYFYSSYVCDDPYTTKRTWKSGFKTAKEAFEAKLKYEQEAKNALMIELNKHTVGYLVHKYLNWKRDTVKISTFHHAESLAIKYLSEPYKKFSIEEFTHAGNLDKFRKQIVNYSFSVDQKNRIFGLVKDVFNYGARAEYCSMHYYEVVAFKLFKLNPNREIKITKKDNYWTLSEWKRFISCFDPYDKWYLFFSLFGHLGCRIGELRGLQNKHVDLINKTITIEQQALNNVGMGKTIISSPKTKSSRRIIPISPLMNGLLKNYISTFRTYNPERFLFFNNLKPIGVSTIRREFDKYIKIAQIKKITLHGVRHSNCTWLLSNNDLNIQQIGQVAERLGHASTKETLDTYMHVHKKQDSSIMNTLDNALEKDKESKDEH